MHVNMAFYQLLRGLTVMVVLSSKGCHSQTSQCGLAFGNTRILGGTDASPGNWPWQASIVNDDGHFCGGTLISDLWVMTAAHCITDATSRIMIYLGRRSQSGPNPEEVSRKVAQIACHPSYNFLTNENDICLLKLSSTVEFGIFIQPVCLAKEGSTFHTGTSSWVTGWGDTSTGTFSDILQEVNIPTVGNNECKCTYPEITENMICAGLRAGGKDACRGDSGGPLVSKNFIFWVQSGIVSFGMDCGKPMTPGVYTRVSKYERWINNITGSSQPGYLTITSAGADSDLNFTCPTSPPATTKPNPNPTTTKTTSTTKTTKTTNTTASPAVSAGEDKSGDSVFDSGENVIHSSHFSHFLSLCVLVLSLHVLIGDS